MAQLSTPVIELVKMLDPPTINLVTVSENALESWNITSPFGKLDDCAKFTISDIEDAFALEDVAAVGKEYTLSFWLKSDAAGYVRTTGGGTFKASADWVKCVSTFTAKETDLSFSFDTPGTYYIYNTQLELGNKATDYRPATEDVDEGISTAQKAAEEARAEAEASGKALASFMEKDFAEALDSLNSQLDKKAETWYQDTDPALLWDTDKKKAAHAGDIWYDTVNKKSYIYMYTQSETEPPETEAPPEGQLAAPFITITSYGWHESDGVPQEVYDKIDGKAQVFSSQPTHPYYVEDLWVQPAVVDEDGNEKEPAGEIMICIKKSTPAGFNEDHWAPASRYIGQAELTNWFDTKYAPELSAISRQLDSKSETWCQSTDPSLNWKDEATRQLHVGDLWLDPTTKETYIYTASGPPGEPTPVDGKLATPYIVLYSWEPTFEIPQDVFDRIDGKAQMFTEKPEKDYFVGDLYIEDPDEDGDREIYKCVKDYDPETANFATDWAPIIDGKHLIKKINLSADEFRIDAKKIFLGGKVKAEHIDVENLFAQDIEATGSITGLTFISEGKLTEENLPASMPNLALILNEAKMEASSSVLTFLVGENETVDHLKTEHTGFGSQYKAKSEDDLGLPTSSYAEQTLDVSPFGICFQGRKARESDFEIIFSVERNGVYWKDSKLATQSYLASILNEFNTVNDEDAETYGILPGAYWGSDRLLSESELKALENPAWTGTLSMNRAEGSKVGDYSAATGFDCVASGNYAQAEGLASFAIGANAHAEGSYTVASGTNSHAEGYGCIYPDLTVSIDETMSYIQIIVGTTYYINVGSVFITADTYEVYARITGIVSRVENADGTYTLTLDTDGLWPAEDLSRSFHLVGGIASGSHSHVEGFGTIATRWGAHAEGAASAAYGHSSHAEGYYTQAGDPNADETSVTGERGQHAEGYQTKATGLYGSHAEGNSTEATGNGAHAEGYKAIAQGNYSHAAGYGTIAYENYQTAIGLYNAISPASNANAVYKFVVGNGSATTRSTSFAIATGGTSYTDGSYSSNAADYAEYFEWKDGNPETEDRVGYAVALDGDKIRLANTDEPIFGIISGSPAVTGDSAGLKWQGMYERDAFGRVIYAEELDEETGETELRPKISTEYDKSQTYIPRPFRDEWDAVGLIGKLYARDDGTCAPGSYAKVGSEPGTLTYSEEKTNIVVMKRTDSNIVRVFLK